MSATRKSSPIDNQRAIKRLCTNSPSSTSQPTIEESPSVEPQAINGGAADHLHVYRQSKMETITWWQTENDHSVNQGSTETLHIPATPQRPVKRRTQKFQNLMRLPDSNDEIWWDLMRFDEICRNHFRLLNQKTIVIIPDNKVYLERTQATCVEQSKPVSNWRLLC